MTYPIVRKTTPNGRADSRYFGKTAVDLNREHQAWTWAQPAITRCGYCDWTLTGTLEDGHTAFLQHRAAEHAQIPVPKRKRFRSFRQQTLDVHERRRAEKDAA